MLPRASVDCVENSDRDEDDNLDEENTHSDGDDNWIPLSLDSGDLDPSSSPTLVQPRDEV